MKFDNCRTIYVTYDKNGKQKTFAATELGFTDDEEPTDEEISDAIEKFINQHQHRSE